MQKRLLVFTNSALGDNIYTLPILDELLQKGNKLLVFTTQKTIYWPYLGKITILDRNKPIIRWLVKFILQHLIPTIKLGYQPGESILQGYYRSSNLPLPQQLSYPHLQVKPADKAKFSYLKGAALLNINSIKNIPHRGVYGIDWPQVVDFLKSHGLEVYEVGLSSTLPNSKLIPTQGTNELIAAISQATLFIGLDSGPAHIAACFSIPSLVFMGPVIPERRHILQQFNGVLLQNPCEFAGCFHNTQSPTGQPCQLTDAQGKHVCCTFTTQQINAVLSQIIQNYKIKPNNNQTPQA